MPTNSAKYSIEIETKNALQTCKVKGIASSKLVKKLNGSYGLEMRAEKMPLQPGSSWSCPASLGPIQINVEADSLKSQKFKGTIDIQRPDFPLVPLGVITSQLDIDIDKPLGAFKNTFFSSQKPGVLPGVNSLRVDIGVTYRTLGIIPLSFFRSVDMQKQSEGDYQVQLRQNLFINIPLPPTMMSGRLQKIKYF